MRVRTDASLGTKGPRAPTRRSLRRRWRTGVLVGAFGLLALFSGAQAAAASTRPTGTPVVITGTSNNHCAGEALTIVGTGFGAAGTTGVAHFKQLLSNGGTNQQEPPLERSCLKWATPVVPAAP